MKSSEKNNDVQEKKGKKGQQRKKWAKSDKQWLGVIGLKVVNQKEEDQI